LTGRERDAMRLIFSRDIFLYVFVFPVTFVADAPPAPLSPPFLPCSLDPFLKKDWYDIKAPSMFSVKQVGKTLVTRSQGTKIASDGLKGRVFECSLADLNQVRLRVVGVMCELGSLSQGYKCGLED